MGEAKRRRERLTPVQLAAERLSHKLADEGLLIKAGFIGYMAACFPDAEHQPGPLQAQALQDAFMAGSVHLFASIMVVLDPGDEPTERDFQRLDLINKELNEYREMLEHRVAVRAKTEGNA